MMSGQPHVAGAAAAHGELLAGVGQLALQLATLLHQRLDAGLDIRRPRSSAGPATAFTRLRA